MSLFRVGAMACIFCIASTARAAVDDDAHALGRTVRLAYAALGCATSESLQRIMAAASQGDDKTTLAELSKQGCRPFTTFHGEIIDAKDGMLCLLGIGNSRCLWFPADMTEPAKRY